MKFPYPLTIYSRKNDLRFAEKQLKKDGAQENIDYIWKPHRTDKVKFAIFTTGKLLDPQTVKHKKYIKKYKEKEKVKGNNETRKKEEV